MIHSVRAADRTHAQQTRVYVMLTSFISSSAGEFYDRSPDREALTNGLFCRRASQITQILLRDSAIFFLFFFFSADPSRSPPSRPRAHLLQPPALLLLLLDTLLPLGQQLALVLLLLAELLLLQELLAPQRLRALLVLLLQPDEVAAKGRLARHVDDGAAREEVQ